MHLHSGVPVTRREGSRVTLTADPAHLPKPEETTNLCACLALFAALLGLIPVTVVFAFIAFSEVQRRPYERGAGIAISALLIAIVEIIATLIALRHFGLPPFNG